jgi:hypothetical protein
MVLGLAATPLRMGRVRSFGFGGTGCVGCVGCATTGGTGFGFGLLRVGAGVGAAVGVAVGVADGVAVGTAVAVTGDVGAAT